MALENPEGPVSVDFSSLTSWEPGGSEHYVNLGGVLEDRWVEAFVLVRRRSARFARFHLNRSRNRVSFLCRSADDPGRARAVLGDLDLLVTLANQRAALTEAEALDETLPAAPPRPDGEEEAGEPAGPPSEVAVESAAVESPARQPAPAPAPVPAPPAPADDEPTVPFASRAPLAARISDAIHFSLEAASGPASRSRDTAALARGMGAAFLVLEDGGGEDEAIAALLPLDEEESEDESASRLEQIRERFGDRAAVLARGRREAQSALKPGGDPRLYSLYFRHSSAPVRRLVCA
ncbi:MAG: hypothetical protein ABI914_04500, partial [Acidobacteriota bacterium]